MRDLAGDGGGLRAVRGPRHALVQTVETARPDGRELCGRRLVLDHDRDAPELVAEGGRECLERVDHEAFEVRLGGGSGCVPRVVEGHRFSMTLAIEK